MTAPITSGKLADLSEDTLATWKLQHDHGKVTLLYFQASQATARHCGGGDVRLLPDVLAWCIDTAAVADLVIIEDAVFARLPTPAALHGRVLAS